MPIRDELGTRMKEFYENIPKTKLMRRTPVAIRIDGKAFHTFTKGFDKPFDGILIESMQKTMKYLCENIQGCVLGYTQSDEITLILIDYQKLTSCAWFDYEIQKICSVSSSMATMAFNFYFQDIISKYFNSNDYTRLPYWKSKSMTDSYFDIGFFKLAMFDSRCFNIPKEEVANLIYWRQLDATRNSIQMVGQSQFSHKELQGKSCNQIQDMLMIQKNINWNDLPTTQKRGSCCIKKDNSWIIDTEIPIFKNEGRNYIEKLIYIEDENK